MRKFLHIVTSLLGIVLFVVAAVIIHHKLRAYHYHDIVAELAKMPMTAIFAALVLTFLDYLVLTGYDALALRYIGEQLPYPKIAVASFVGYAFSHNATVLGGSAARYRIYSSLGISGADVARLVTFCAMTFWIGFFTIGGLAFLFQPHQIPPGLHIPLNNAKPIGVVFVLLLAIYFTITATKGRPGSPGLKIFGWEFTIPSLRLSLGQVMISSIDWVLASSVLYVLLSQTIEITYPQFLVIFLLAQIIGIISTVPGGLGVFESIVLFLLADVAPPSSLVGSLLVYRAIYYLLPLAIASIILGGAEVVWRRDKLKKFSAAVTKWGEMLIPNIFAFSSLMAGAILLVSGALPEPRGRMEVLRDFLPLPAIEISHFLGSIAGAGLIILARGLQRRLDAAYHLTIMLLAAGIVFSFFKGFDYEEAIILSIMLAALIPCKKQFYRKASILRDRFSLPWTLLVIAVVASSIWLGLFSYKHVTYSSELFWRFAFEANSPRFLRASTGVVIVLLLVGLARLFVPAKHKHQPLEEEEHKIVETIVRNCPKTYAWLALLDDKRFLLGDNEDSFLMFGVQGRSWISMGDPVGPDDRASELAWEFRETCDLYDAWPVFYQVDSDHLDIYLDMGLTLLKLGEEAKVNLPDFSLEGRENRDLRHAQNKISKMGFRFSIIEPAQVAEAIDELKQVSDGWLDYKNTKEKRFSLGSFKPEYLKKMPVAIVTQNDPSTPSTLLRTGPPGAGKIIAFANIWQGAGKEELSIDLMRYLPESPEGIMDYLFAELMLWGKTQGYHWFNLGAAPLSGLEDRALAPLWLQAGAFLFRHGEHFYNFQGLRQYKEKFAPVWQPKYLACPRGLMLPRILTNLATLISGGLKGIVTK